MNTQNKRMARRGSEKGCPREGENDETDDIGIQISGKCEAHGSRSRGGFLGGGKQGV
jgi:hypothetical protein